jgi:O-Antigen ligase
MKGSRRSLASSLVGFALALGSFGLFLTLVLPAGRSPMTLRHLALAATWAAAGILSFRSAQSGLRPAIMSPSGLVGLGLLGAIALRGPVTVEGLEILLTWGGFLVAGLALSEVLGPRERRDLLAGLLTCGLLFALEGILESCGLLELRRRGVDLDALGPAERPFFQSTRARSVFGQANGLGSFTLMMLALIAASLVSWWRSRQESAPWRRGLFTLGVFAAALIATRSQGSIAVLSVLAVGAFALLWRRAANPLERWLGLVLTLVLGCLLFVLGTETVLTFTGRIYHPAGHPLHTLSLRGDYARTAARLIAEDPVLGVGWNLYAENASRVWVADEGFSRRPHNAVLGLAAEIGSLGWALALALLVGAWRWLRSIEAPVAAAAVLGNSPRRAVVLGALGALLIALSQGALPLLPPDERGEPRAVLNCLVVLALALVLGRVLARPMATSMLTRPGLRRAAVFLAVGFGLHCLIDIDLWVPNLTATLTLFMLALGVRPESRPLRSRWLVLSLCLVVTFLGVGFATRAQPAAAAEAYRNWLGSETRLKPSPGRMQARYLELSLAAAEARPISRRALEDARDLLVLSPHEGPRGDEPFRASDFDRLRRDWVRARELIARAPRDLRELPGHRRADEILRSALSQMEGASSELRQAIVEEVWRQWSVSEGGGW